MRISTLGRKKIFQVFAFLAFFAGLTKSSAQCPTVINPNQTFCDIQSPTVANLVATNNGGGVRWYANATGGTALSNSSGLINNEDYFADDNSGSCGTRQKVVVTINSTPRPTGNSFQGPCVESLNDATLLDFDVTGSNIKWYSNSSGGSPLPLTTIIVNGTTYYASQTDPVTGCESLRKAVQAKIGLVPTPTGDPTQDFCNDPNNIPTVGSLVASGSNNWYESNGSSTPLDLTTPLVNGEDYYATTVDPPCESITRFRVDVTLVKPNDAGTNGSRSICVSDLATTLPFDLYKLLGGNPDKTGTWSGPLSTINGYLGTVNISSLSLVGSPYTFTYSVSSAQCATDTSIVTITVLPLPDASITTTTLNVCSGSAGVVTFTGTPNATVTYNIDGGLNKTILLDSGGSAILNPIVLSDTTYNLVSVSSSGTPSCSKLISGSIRLSVIALPTVTVNSPAPVCQGVNATLAATPGTPGSYSYAWTVPSGVTNPGNKSSFQTTAAGIYSVKITNLTTTCVSAVANGTVTVNPLPTVIVNTPSTCPGLNVTVSATANPLGNYTYEWVVPLGVTNPGNQSSFSTSTAGIYSVVITNTSTSCASQSAQGTVIVNPIPTVTIDTAPVCLGTPATVSATANPPGNYTYAWIVPSGAINPGNQSSFSTSVAGIYSVVVTNTSTGCKSQSVPTTVVINSIPTVTIDTAPVCLGTPATVSATANPPGNYTYVWTVPSGAINPGNQSSFSTSVAGIYNVVITNTSTGCKSQSVPTTVVINPIPTVNINTTPVCLGTPATVSATANPPGNYTYVWTVPSGVTNPGNQSSFSTTTAGVYSVIVTNTSTACSSQSAQNTVVINPIPTVVVSTTPVCVGTPATVSATANPTGNYTYAWTVPSGATNPGNQSSFSTSIAGIYSVVVTNSSTACPSQSVPTTVIINNLPSVIISSSQEICSGQSATITFTGTPNATVTYLIDEEDTATIVLNASGKAEITKTYTKGASYTLVSVTSTGSLGCTVPVTDEVSIDVVPLPIVSIESDVTTICSGSTATVTFTGTPNSIVTYTVNGGSNQTISIDDTGINSITNTYTVPTTFKIVSSALSGNANCNQPQAGEITINVEPLPTVGLSPNQTICSGQKASVTFTGTPNATVTYTVNGGSNQTIQLNNLGAASIEDTYLVTTVYTLVSVASLSTPVCTQPQTGSMTITVSPPPTVVISSSQEICSGQSATITFTGTPNATVTYLIDEEDTATIVLDASGKAEITKTYTKGSSYALVSITSSGSLGCTVPATGEVSIDVVPLPIVSIESDVTTICSGSTATVTFTGTPNSIVTYTVNGGSNQTITLDDSGINLITSTYTVATTFALVSSALSGNASCSQPQTGEITINVEPLPTVSLSSNQTICSGQKASVTFTGTPNATVTYTVNGGSNETILLDNSGSAILKDVTYTSTTVFSLVSITTTGSPGCSNPQTGSTTINVLPLPIVTISADPSVCSGSSAKVTFTGTPNATVTYTVNGGSNQTLLLDGAGKGEIISVIATTSTYTLVSVESQGTPICSKPLTESVTIAVNPLPTATVSSSPTVCSGTNTTVTFTGTPNSIVTYTINGGNNQTIAIGASGSAVLNTSLNVTSTYTLVSVTLANPPSCNQLLSASTTSTVTQPPVAGSNASLSICSESTPQDLFLLLGSNAQPGGTWSPTLASGTGVFNPLLDSAGSYVYTVAGTPPCVNDTALVTVTITPAANAGTNTQVDLCSNADSVDLLTLLGGTPQSGGTWSPALTSGTGIFDPSKDSAGVYTYTVGGTTPCLNDSATVTITITPGLNAGNSGTATFCLDSAPIDLFLSLGGTPQVGGTWSPALSSGTGIFNPAIDQSGVYTYAFSGTEPCSNDTATVTVTVNPLPDAGENAAASICSNVDFKDLFTFLGGAPQAGGTWSPALASGTGIFNPAVDKAGVYTYTVGNPFCNPDSADVTVTIVPGPDAGVSGNVTFCATNAPQDLFLSLGGTPQVGGTWSPPLASGTGVFNPAVDNAGVYTYTFEGNQPCDDDTATVTVKVDPIANAGTFVGTQNVCNSAGNLDLFTLLSGNQVGGVWTDVNNQTISNPIDVSKLSPNTYSYTYTITNSCGSDSETVQFTILTNPVLAAANIAISSSNCKGNNVTVTLSNMVDGNYTINYNLSLANVLANQNANVNIVNGSGTFTINSTDILNIGTTRVTFLSITNITTTCITLINPNVSADFILKPSPNLETKNIVIDDICIGSSLKVVISGATAGLVDGNYQFAYSIPNATPTNGNSGNVTITEGSGQFTVPASYFTNAGDYNFTITSITNLTSGCNNLSEDASAAFQVFPIPDVSGATINAASACLNFSNEVFITGAINLSDGIYTINYQLSGANSSTSSSSVTFVNGRGSFIIPATDLNDSGNVTITVTQLTSNVSQCGSSASVINPFTFAVTQLETPEIVTKGNEFCDADNPTIADLSANVTTSGTIVWYDVPTGGQALNDTDLLEDGNTYYGAVRSTSGCESIIRLEVIVDLNKCDDVLIPDGFSPNGDKINDEFVIKNIENKYPNYRLEIYNRYGAILYKGNRNTPNWDGTTTQGGIKFGDSKVPVGVYFYILEFNDGTTKPKQGRLYLSR